MKLIPYAAAGVMLALMIGATPSGALCEKRGTIVAIDYDTVPLIILKTNSLARFYYFADVVDLTSEPIFNTDSQLGWFTTLSANQTQVLVVGDAESCPETGEERYMGAAVAVYASPRF